MDVQRAADTIYALSSAAGRAAIAVIRISGPQAADALQAMAGTIPTPRQAALRTLRDPSSHLPIDQALVLYFKAPSSETGEDIVEFQVHGGRAVVASVMSALAAIPGCRIAEPGEFVRRAFNNGKLDLTAVEGLADLIDAETEAQRVQALAQAGGELARLYDGWRASLIEAQALIEAAIDFSDERDVSAGAVDDANVRVQQLLEAIDGHLNQTNRGEIVRTGYKVVIAGPPNAGKSSLLNALAQRDAAIVSSEPGTTRDVIDVRLDFDGLPVVISDTAGIRDAAGPIEREGIKRTMDRARTADLIVWLVDATAPHWSPAANMPIERVVRVLNKSDLALPTTVGCDVAVSSRTGDGLEQLATLIVGRAREELGASVGPAPTQERHRVHLSKALAHLTDFLHGRRSDLELRAEDLRLSANEIGRLTGRIDAEEVLGKIFGRFCIGK